MRANQITPVEVNVFNAVVWVLTSRTYVAILFMIKQCLSSSQHCNNMMILSALHLNVVKKSVLIIEETCEHTGDIRTRKRTSHTRVIWPNVQHEHTGVTSSQSKNWNMTSTQESRVPSGGIPATQAVSVLNSNITHQLCLHLNFVWIPSVCVWVVVLISALGGSSIHCCSCNWLLVGCNRNERVCVCVCMARESTCFQLQEQRLLSSPPGSAVAGWQQPQTACQQTGVEAFL